MFLSPNAGGFPVPLVHNSAVQKQLFRKQVQQRFLFAVPALIEACEEMGLLFSTLPERLEGEARTSLICKKLPRTRATAAGEMPVISALSARPCLFQQPTTLPTSPMEESKVLRHTENSGR